MHELWMIVTEDLDGQWFNDPKVYRTREPAEKWASSHLPLDGYCHILYQCTYVRDLDTYDPKQTNG